MEDSDSNIKHDVICPNWAVSYGLNPVLSNETSYCTWNGGIGPSSSLPFSSAI